MKHRLLNLFELTRTIFPLSDSTKFLRNLITGLLQLHAYNFIIVLVVAVVIVIVVTAAAAAAAAAAFIAILKRCDSCNLQSLLTMIYLLLFTHGVVKKTLLRRVLRPPTCGLVIRKKRAEKRLNAFAAFGVINNSSQCLAFYIDSNFIITKYLIA
uniref:Uncharacterized protein n=1 Tax=Glossina palpalis gambiensis TaxID=67801 RepID=A0A1B0ARU9_9MUSC